MTTHLVIGGSGKIGGYIVRRLIDAGETPFAMSRIQRSDPCIKWVVGDLKLLPRLWPVDCIFCTVDATIFAEALPSLITPLLKRVIVFTTTSVITKLDSEIEAERILFERIVAAENKIIEICKANGVAYTILRPTLVYDEGRDRNVSRLARLIRRFHVMPVVGAANGLRQPVHADDLALAAVAASRVKVTENKTYVLANTETITYAEMIGRVFDGVGRRRMILHIPEPAWRLAFAAASPMLRGFNPAMGRRMNCDMTFDVTEAQSDFGWSPRDFHPLFNRATLR